MHSISRNNLSSFYSLKIHFIEFKDKITVLTRAYFQNIGSVSENISCISKKLKSVLVNPKFLTIFMIAALSLAILKKNSKTKLEDDNAALKKQLEDDNANLKKEFQETESTCCDLEEKFTVYLAYLKQLGLKSEEVEKETKSTIDTLKQTNRTLAGTLSVEQREEELKFSLKTHPQRREARLEDITKKTNLLESDQNEVSLLIEKLANKKIKKTEALKNLQSAKSQSTIDQKETQKITDDLEEQIKIIDNKNIDITKNLKEKTDELKQIKKKNKIAAEKSKETIATLKKEQKETEQKNEASEELGKVKTAVEELKPSIETNIKELQKLKNEFTTHEEIHNNLQNQKKQLSEKLKEMAAEEKRQKRENSKADTRCKEITNGIAELEAEKTEFLKLPNKKPSEKS